MAKQAPAIPIWAADSSGLDPKRAHRFILNLADVPAYFVKTSGVPQLTIANSAKHQFLGHTFKFPGSATWNDSLDVVLVDTIDYNMAQKFADYIRTAGYVYPSQWNESSSDPQFFRKTISKAKFPFKQMRLDRIDADGVMYESWVLNNCFINKVQFGDHGYDKEDLMNVTVSITYDWAELRDSKGNVPAYPK
jgi:hypothetical protein